MSTIAGHLSGTRLGPYEIVAPIGAGGMGEVYRARDPRLKRDVAIKVLLPEVAGDPERIARFEREAQLLAALNHPHIAAIYGVEQAGDTTALVLEYVEGPTLADRIARGPLPLDEALPIARQIAAALEAAHEQGIIHRDLKPANVKVRDDGTVKVLDFGLAKAVEGAVQSGRPGQAVAARPDLTHSPTLTSPVGMTGVGVLLGTAAYMSPEQAKRRAADKRADIWAFGCVLFEMLTGERVFGGDDLTDTLAAIMRDQPDVTKVPRQVRRLLLKCLEKDPKQRLRDIGDVWDLLDDAAPAASQGAVAPAARWPAWTGWALAIGATAVAAWLFIAPRRTQPSSVSAAGPTWLNVALPDALRFIPNTLHRSAVITPDGRSIVYATRNGLAVRRLDSGTSTLLPDTEGGRAPFVSADGQRVGFSSETAQIVWTPIRGGPLQPLVAASAVGSGGFTGATFLADGGIVFSSAATLGLMRVSAGGGSPQRLTSIDRTRSERLHEWPAALPDGRGLLFTIASGLPDRPTFEIAALDLSSGQYRTLATGTQPAYVDGGYVTFVQDGHLFVAGFDPQRFELTSPAIPLVEQVAVMQQGAAEYSISRSGTLAFVPGPVERTRTLAWMDPSGHETELPVPRLGYVYPRVSPDGRHLAVDVRGNNAQTGYVGIYDIAKQVLTRLANGAESAQYPIWWPDSRGLFFQAPAVGLMSQAIDGGTARQEGAADAVLSADPSGRRLIIGKNAGGLRWLNLLTRGADGGEVTLLKSDTAWIFNGEISPDGRFLAFQSSQTGRYEVLVAPFPAVTSARWQVSDAGGTRPAWSRDGKELFFLDLSGAMMRVTTNLQPTFSAGTPAKLFDSLASVAAFPPGRNYDVAPDGRFLLVKDSFASAPRPLEFTIALDWIANVRASVGRR